MIDYTPLVARPHPGRPTVPLELPKAERQRTLTVAQSPNSTQRVAQRAQALLMLSDGVAAADVAVVLGLHVRTVHRWRKRFACAVPSEKLADAPRPGRPPSLSRMRMR